jgi:CrcB protein
MAVIFVGLGGFFGAAARYFLGKFLFEKIRTILPSGTLIINISGAFLLGVISALKTAGDIYLLLAVGFLGAFTTFSTFMYEEIKLLLRNKKISAFLYIIISVIFGVGAYMAGYALGQAI